MALINPLLGSNLVSGDAPFDTSSIPNSVWFDTGDHLTQDTAASDSGRKEAIFSTWVQRTVFGAQGFLLGVNGSDVNDHLALDFQSTNKLRLTASSTTILETTQVFEDTAWYHILVTIDTSRNSDSSQKIFVNGVEVTDFSTRNNFGSSADIAWGRSATHLVNSDPSSAGSNQMVGYMAQTALITDKSFQQGDFSITNFLDSFAFGTNGSQFSPKTNAAIATMVGTGGNNSFFLNYETASDLGNDGSSKNNDFSDVGMAAANQETHTPSKSYSIFNPLITGDQGGAAGTFTLTEGGQKVAIDNSNSWLKTTVPFEMSGSNIIRAQFTIDTVGNAGVGISGSHHCSGTYHTSAYTLAGRGEVLLLADGSLVIDGNFGGSGYSSALSNGDVVDVIVNLNAGAVYFAVDGTLCNSATQSEIQAGTTTNAANAGSFVRRTAGEVFNFMAAQTNPNPTTITYNSGHSSFSHSYSTITSLISLNSADLPTPSFQGKDFFDTTLYNGNGATQRVGDFIPFTDTYTVDNSAMFQHDDVRNLSRTIEAPSSSGGKKGTWSVWYKTANIDTDNVFFDTGTTATNRFSLQMDASGQIVFSHGGTTILKTSGDFKGGGTWHNLVLKVDTALGTASARAIMFIDGVEITSFETDSRSSLSQDAELGYMDEGATQFVGSFNNSSANQWDGYLAEVVFLDNQFLDASSFGQLDTSTNRWVPKSVSGLTFGNCGSYLEFKVAPATSNGAGTDTSGNSNHFTNNGSWANSDQFIDTPSNSFPIIARFHGAAAGTVSEGNTKLIGGSDAMLAVGWSENNPATPSGKYFMEFSTGTVTGGNVSWCISGAAHISVHSGGSSGFGFVGQETNQAGVVLARSTAAAIYKDGSQVGSDVSLGFTLATSDLGVVALDTENNDAWIGYWDSGSPSQITWVTGTGTVTTTFPSTNPTFDIGSIENPVFAIYANASSRHVAINAGSQMVFNGAATTLSADAGGRFLSAAAIPTGFKALSVDSLDDTASKITGWAWIKNREAADNNVLFDRIRGVGNDLHSNRPASTTNPAPAEVSNANTLQRFLQRGVQVGSDVEVNTSNEDYVLWQWLLGDSATTGSSLTGGSPTITTTGLVSAANHFSILSYTGNATDDATISHGLSAAPEMVMHKERDNANNWIVGFTAVGYDKILKLDQTDAAAADADAWNDTAPNATRITLGDGNATNRSGGKMICYAFRSIPGVCKVGIYQGSNEANGPFVALGFKPAFFMAKNIDTAGSWFILDSKRGFNAYLQAEDVAVETTGTTAKQFADGMKWATTGVGNAADTFVYLAMADIGGNGTLPPIYGV